MDPISYLKRTRIRIIIRARARLLIRFECCVHCVIIAELIDSILNLGSILAADGFEITWFGLGAARR